MSSYTSQLPVATHRSASVAIDRRRILNAICGVAADQLDAVVPQEGHAAFEAVDAALSALFAKEKDAFEQTMQMVLPTTPQAAQAQSHSTKSSMVLPPSTSTRARFGTIHGPHGANPSNDLPKYHCWCRF